MRLVPHGQGMPYPRGIEDDEKALSWYSHPRALMTGDQEVPAEDLVPSCGMLDSYQSPESQCILQRDWLAPGMSPSLSQNTSGP